MNLQHFRYVEAISRHQNISKAAKELFISQPALTRSLNHLEEELGVTLFQRTGSGIVPTEDAERIRFYAQNALKYVALVKESSAETDARHLRIAANPSATLPLCAGRFFMQNRKEELDLHYTVCRIEHIMDLMEHRLFDLGFLLLPGNRVTAFSRMLEPRRLEFKPLLESDLVLYCGQKSPFHGKTAISPEELDGCRCIQPADNFFALEDLLLENKAFHTGKCAIRKQIRTNSDSLIMQILRETDLCNIGSFWHRKERFDSEFSLSVIDGFQGKVSFGVITREGSQLSETAEEFLNTLTREVLE